MANETPTVPSDTTPSLPGSLTVETAADVLSGLLSPKGKKANPAEDAPSEKELETPDEGTPESDQPEQVDEEVAEEGKEPEGDEAVDPDANPEQEAPEEKVTEPQKFKVKIDGVESEVTEDELLNGYSRHSDYTRKTQELAEARKKFEAEELPAVRAERQQLAEQLTQVAEALKAMAPQEPDWDKMRIENPEQFANARAEWQLIQERMQAVEAAKKEAQAKVDGDRIAQINEYTKAENAKLLEKVPTWKDSKVMDAEVAEIAKYAKELGYSDDDLNGIRDHRLMLMLRDALNGKKASEKKPEIRNTITRVRTATPGPTETNRPKVAEVTRLRQRLAKTGKVEDAADILTLLEKEGKL